ncbi:MAG: DUF2079 domain-containing protein [Nitrososphaeria archaeon]
MLTKKFCKLEVAEWIILLMIIAYSTIFSFFLIMKFYSFRTGAYDMGILAQSIAGACKGKLFTNNVELYYSPSGSYFGIHFSPILFITVPFFYIEPKIETLLILHSVILALGCVPVYFIARNCLGSRSSALIISATYLANPVLQGVNWYDFTPQTFFPVLILSATYFFKSRKFKHFLLFLLLTLATIEQSAYFLIAFCFYLFWNIKKELKENFPFKKLALSILPFVTLGLAIFWIFFSSYLKNCINPNPPRELLATENFRVLGVNNLAEIPIKVLGDPESLFKAINYDLSKKLLYILLTFAPSCFLVILSPLALLPAIVWIFVALVSNWPPYYQMGFHYPAFTIPFIFIAFIESIKKLSKLNSGTMHKSFMVRILKISLVVSCIVSVLASPLSPVHKCGDFTYFRDYGVLYPSSLDATARKILDELPTDSTILTTPILFSHLSANINAYSIPPYNHPSERLYSDSINRLKSINFDFVIACFYFWDKSDAGKLYDIFLKGRTDYGLFIFAPGMEIYKSGYNGSPTILPIRFSYKELSTFIGFIVEDGSAESGKVIKCTSSEAKNVAWYGPYVNLREGRYVAKFRVKVESIPTSDKIVKLEVWSNFLGTDIAHVYVYGKDLTESSWHTFAVSFNLSQRVGDVEFRGLVVANNVTVSLDYVEVVPEL